MCAYDTNTLPCPPVPPQPVIRSSLISRNISINNHRTSIRLEPDMWSGLREICRRENASLHDICTAVALRKPAITSLTAAIRVFIMTYFRAAATEDGHSKAGHGPGGSFMASHRTHAAAPKPMAPATNGTMNHQTTPHQHQMTSGTMSTGTMSGTMNGSPNAQPNGMNGQATPLYAKPHIVR